MKYPAGKQFEVKISKKSNMHNLTFLYFYKRTIKVSEKNFIELCIKDCFCVRIPDGGWNIAELHPEGSVWACDGRRSNLDSYSSVTVVKWQYSSDEEREEERLREQKEEEVSL